MTKHQRTLDAIAQAMKLPPISADFNTRLNEAARAGELDAIERLARMANLVAQYEMGRRA